MEHRHQVQYNVKFEFNITFNEDIKTPQDAIKHIIKELEDSPTGHVTQFNEDGKVIFSGSVTVE